MSLEALTVMLVPPLFFSVTVFAMLCPIATVPNERAVGLTWIAPGATAVPDRETRTYPPYRALLLMYRLA